MSTNEIWIKSLSTMITYISLGIYFNNQKEMFFKFIFNDCIFISISFLSHSLENVWCVRLSVAWSVGLFNVKNMSWSLRVITFSFFGTLHRFLNDDFVWGSMCVMSVMIVYNSVLNVAWSVGLFNVKNMRWNLWVLTFSFLGLWICFWIMISYVCYVCYVCFIMMFVSFLFITYHLR